MTDRALTDEERKIIEKYEPEIRKRIWYNYYRRFPQDWVNDIIQAALENACSRIRDFKGDLNDDKAVKKFLTSSAFSGAYHYLRDKFPMFRRKDHKLAIPTGMTECWDTPSKDEVSDTLITIGMYIDKLPNKFQTIFKLYFLEERSAMEVAKILKMNIKTVSDYVKIIKEYLRAKLKE